MEFAIDGGCKNCSSLRNEMDCHMKTLKEKIIGTDKLIRKYQHAEMEADIQTRKAEEFARIVDQLRRDLRNQGAQNKDYANAVKEADIQTRKAEEFARIVDQLRRELRNPGEQNKDYADMLIKFEPLKKMNQKQSSEIKELRHEVVELNNTILVTRAYKVQLEAKIQQLEQGEEEVARMSATTRDQKKKIDALNAQYKEAKETLTKTRRELTRTKTIKKKLVNNALTWGRLAHNGGLLNGIQMRTYLKLRDGNQDQDQDQNHAESGNDSTPELTEESKLLEEMLLSEDPEIPDSSAPSSIANDSISSSNSHREVNVKLIQEDNVINSILPHTNAPETPKLPDLKIDDDPRQEIRLTVCPNPDSGSLAQENLNEIFPNDSFDTAPPASSTNQDRIAPKKGHSSFNTNSVLADPDDSTVPAVSMKYPTELNSITISQNLVDSVFMPNIDHSGSAEDIGTRCDPPPAKADAFTIEEQAKCDTDPAEVADETNETDSDPAARGWRILDRVVCRVVPVSSPSSQTNSVDKAHEGSDPQFSRSSSSVVDPAGITANERIDNSSIFDEGMISDSFPASDPASDDENKTGARCTTILDVSKSSKIDNEESLVSDAIISGPVDPKMNPERKKECENSPSSAEFKSFTTSDAPAIVNPEIQKAPSESVFDLPSPSPLESLPEPIQESTSLATIDPEVSTIGSGSIFDLSSPPLKSLADPNNESISFSFDPEDKSGVKETVSDSSRCIQLESCADLSGKLTPSSDIDPGVSTAKDNSRPTDELPTSNVDPEKKVDENPTKPSSTNIDPEVRKSNDLSSPIQSKSLTESIDESITSNVDHEKKIDENQSKSTSSAHIDPEVSLFDLTGPTQLESSTKSVQESITSDDDPEKKVDENQTKLSSTNIDPEVRKPKDLSSPTQSKSLKESIDELPTSHVDPEKKVDENPTKSTSSAHIDPEKSLFDLTGPTQLESLTKSVQESITSNVDPEKKVDENQTKSSSTNIDPEVRKPKDLSSPTPSKLLIESVDESITSNVDPEKEVDENPTKTTSPAHIDPENSLFDLTGPTRLESSTKSVQESITFNIDPEIRRAHSSPTPVMAKESCTNSSTSIDPEINPVKDGAISDPPKSIQSELSTGSGDQSTALTVIDPEIKEVPSESVANLHVPLESLPEPSDQLKSVSDPNDGSVSCNGEGESVTDPSNSIHLIPGLTSSTDTDPVIIAVEKESVVPLESCLNASENSIPSNKTDSEESRIEKDNDISTTSTNINPEMRRIEKEISTQLESCANSKDLSDPMVAPISLNVDSEVNSDEKETLTDHSRNVQLESCVSSNEEAVPSSDIDPEDLSSPVQQNFPEDSNNKSTLSTVPNPEKETSIDPESKLVETKKSIFDPTHAKSSEIDPEGSAAGNGSKSTSSAVPEPRKYHSELNSIPISQNLVSSVFMPNTDPSGSTDDVGARCDPPASEVDSFTIEDQPSSDTSPAAVADGHDKSLGDLLLKTSSSPTISQDHPDKTKDSDPSNSLKRKRSLCLSESDSDTESQENPNDPCTGGNTFGKLKIQQTDHPCSDPTFPESKTDDASAHPMEVCPPGTDPTLEKIAAPCNHLPQVNLSSNPVIQTHSNPILLNKTTELPNPSARIASQKCHSSINPIHFIAASTPMMRSTSGSLNPSAKIAATPPAGAAFKVPKIPTLDASDLLGSIPRARSNSSQRSQNMDLDQDYEVAHILKDIRRNTVPRALSPLPASPVTIQKCSQPSPRIAKDLKANQGSPGRAPQAKKHKESPRISKDPSASPGTPTAAGTPEAPATPVTPGSGFAQPKNRFPRCTFNWTGKKLPISAQLTETYGGYLHTGFLNIRVRFRKIGKLGSIRFPDQLCNAIKEVCNFAEAEMTTLQDSTSSDHATAHRSSNGGSTNNSALFGDSSSSSSSSESEIDDQETPSKRKKGSGSSQLAPNLHKDPPPRLTHKKQAKAAALTAVTPARPSSLFRRSNATGRPVITPLGSTPSMKPYSVSSPVQPVSSLSSQRMVPLVEKLNAQNAKAHSGSKTNPSDPLTSLLSKAKTAPTKVVATAKRSLQPPITPSNPSTPCIDPGLVVDSSDSIDAAAPTPKKRVAHPLKRPLDPVESSVPVVPCKKKAAPVHVPESKEPVAVVSMASPRRSLRNKGRSNESMESIELNEPKEPMEPTESRELSSGSKVRKEDASESIPKFEMNPSNRDPVVNQIQDHPCSPEALPELEVDDVVEDSPLSPPADECGLSLANGENTSLAIPLSPERTVDAEKLSAFDLVFKKIQSAQPIKPFKMMKKNKTRINLTINKLMKAEELTSDLLTDTVNGMMLPSCLNEPSFFIRHLLACVIKGAEDEVDKTHTPPAPPLTVKQQRCVALLRSIDDRHIALKRVDHPDFNQDVFTDHFLDELSHVLFKFDSTLSMEEMRALCRTYTAICRSRSQLSRARVFLYDCFYHFPPQAYALTHTILLVWAEILRHVTFPTGLTCMDQAMVYLLFTCHKVKAVPGLAGKVTQVRSFIEKTYGYETTPSTTIDSLVTYFMTRLMETTSIDEASSIACGLKLLSRWEGIDWSLNLIETHLWRFLEDWSNGKGNDPGAVAAITCIGTVGKDIPGHKLLIVKKVLTVLESLLTQGSMQIQEAALKSLIILGERHDPQTVIQLLKTWIPDCLSPDNEMIATNFLKKFEV